MDDIGTVLHAVSVDVWLAKLQPALTSGFTPLLAAAGDPALQTTPGVTAWWSRLAVWWHDTYRHAPALVVGLTAMLCVPAFAVLGLLMRTGRRRRPQVPAAGMTDAISSDVQTGSARGDGLTWPVAAWVEIEGQPKSRVPVVREILRIGREEDNDLVVPAETVHRYHAVIHRTEDADIVVIDTSGNEGNGVAVNGKRASRQQLRGGDVIEIGKARLKFSTRRVGALAG